MIGLIACSSQKLGHAAIARRLYSSPLFQKSLAYAERRCMSVYVMSAAHGLVGVEDFVQPYNQRLGRKAEREQWGRRTVAALQGRHENYEDLLVMAGDDYARPLRSALRDVNWGGEISEPLAGMQVGERLSWLNGEIARMPLQLPAPGGSPDQRAAALWLTPRPPGDEHACSFCGISERKATRMISGPEVRICGGCVELCVDLVDVGAVAA